MKTSRQTKNLPGRTNAKRKQVARITNSDFLRSWGILNPNTRFKTLRYQYPIEKGIYWYHFSRWVRNRDVQTFGTCISCGRPLNDIDSCDAGHFMPAEDCGRDLLFDKFNVNAECPRCNAWDSTHLLGYAEELDRRYGIGTALTLRNRREEYKRGPPVKDWSKQEYIIKLHDLGIYQIST